MKNKKLTLTDWQLNTAIILMVLVCVVLSQPFKGWQAIQASPQAYNFGSVKEGTEIQATFHLKNSSLRTVEITGVSGGCGCTRAFPDRKLPFSLKPFESVVLKAALDTNRQGGFVQKPIFVTTSDNKKSIEVTAFVGTVR